MDLLGHSPAGAVGTVLGLSRAVQAPHAHPFQHGSAPALEPSWGVLVCSGGINYLQLLLISDVFSIANYGILSCSYAVKK